MSGEARPRFLLIGGPNGSGKTTVLAPRVTVPVINADEIARRLSRPDARAAAAEARELASAQVADHLRRGASFGVESTLVRTADLDLLRKAKAAGFETELLAVWSGELDVSLERVRLRVLRGAGHHVPEAEVRMRYEGAVETLPLMLGAADLATVWDNSRPEPDGPREVLSAENGVVLDVDAPAPGWLIAAFERWCAPLQPGADLSELAANPRQYRAGRLLDARRAQR